MNRHYPIRSTRTLSCLVAHRRECCSRDRGAIHRWGYHVGSVVRSVFSAAHAGRVDAKYMEGGLRQWFLAIVVVLMSTSVLADEALDQIAISELDRRFQAAVKHNDAATMAEILHEDMILVVGDGRTFTREEQLRDAKQKLILYDIQDEEPGTQTVRVHGDTGIVTALLHIKGSRNGLPIERHLWFSDTYVRTPTGWKYLFGQASLALPPNA
jgi:ketosteroid isomerase-like protein